LQVFFISIHNVAASIVCNVDLQFDIPAVTVNGFEKRRHAYVRNSNIEIPKCKVSVERANLQTATTDFTWALVASDQVITIDDKLAA